MRQRLVINEELEQSESIKMLAEAYQEISVTKIQSTRGIVLNNREYLEKLSEIFYDVRSSYLIKLSQLFKKKGQKKASSESFLVKNGKTVAVFMSANSKLYGGIVPKVYDYFIEYITNNPSDIVIVGKLGELIYNQSNIDKPYLYFELSDVEVNIEELLPLIAKVLEYEKVMVFYGKFVNILNQSASFSSISGQAPFPQGVARKEEKEKFIFEPSLEKVLVFFESQIIYALFKQTVNESVLARFASRITAMEEVLQNVDKKLKDLENQKKRAKRYNLQKKQLETAAAVLYAPR